MTRGWIAGLAVIALGLSACRTPQVVPYDLSDGLPPRKGVLHPIERGQTLWRIARAYGVSLQELAEINDIADPAQIQAGAALWVPGAERVLKIDPAGASNKPDANPSPSTGTAVRKPDDDDPPPKLDVRPSRFIWPVKGVLFSRFGVRDGTQHEGIDIAAPKGTQIVAADGGDVIYAGVQRGYGNIILVKHVDGLITIYAHNDAHDVKQGDRVSKGQPIAKVGATGRASGPHVHFEVRQDRQPRNPLFFLPAPP